MRTWGERQYTLIGHNINCTELQITTDYIPFSSDTSVPLAGVQPLLDEVSDIDEVSLGRCLATS